MNKNPCCDTKLDQLYSKITGIFARVLQHEYNFDSQLHCFITVNFRGKIYSAGISA